MTLQNALHLLTQRIWQFLCLQHRLRRKPQPKIAQRACRFRITCAARIAGTARAVFVRAANMDKRIFRRR